MLAEVEMSVGGSAEAARRLRPAVEFLHNATRCCCPANTFVIVESSSSLTTGAIAYGREEKQQRYATLPNLVSAFLGGDVISAMSDGSAFARQAKASEKPSFFQGSARVRGGWRGLFLIADGPTVRIPGRKDEVVRMIDG